MNRPVLLGLRRCNFIDWLSQHIKQTAKCFFSYRYRNRSSRRYSIHTADKSVRRSECNTTHGIIPQMLCYFNDQFSALF